MRFVTKRPNEIESDTIVSFVFEDDDKTGEVFDFLDKKSNGELSKQIFQYNGLDRKFGEYYKYSIDEKTKVIVYGLGKRKKLTRKTLSQASASASRLAKNVTKNNSVAFEVVSGYVSNNSIESNFSKPEAARIILLASRIGFYEFDKYKRDKKNKIETIEIVDENITDAFEREVEIGAYTSFAMKFAKDLVNESAQIVTPCYVANLASQIAKDYNLEEKIYDKKQIKNLNMNAFLAVGQGSIHEPRFVHLKYSPANTPRRKIALVGKGITFDAGGMNIKPATSMLTMKSDMTGAATVLGVIQAISQLKPDIELHIITALCENMTSGSAYKQGDVLTAMNGKTIEVDNTDAEGRITLADALCYADTLGVDEVIDIATLTGAVIVSLGNNITGVMGNNQAQIDKFISSSIKSAENTWQMPILGELKDNLKSNIADMKNTGGRLAGTSTAAWFLSNFTKSENWLHLDIAGTAYLEKSNRETSFGPTGVMVRSLINYILDI